MRRAARMQPRIQDGWTGASARGVPEAKVVEAIQKGRRRKMTELETMGYTVEQAEEVARIASSIAQTSGV